MKAKYFVFILFTLFLLSQVSWAQLESPLLGGSRAYSMGGVYTATNYGAEALLGNPGGLGLLSQAQVIVGGRMTVLGTSSMEEDYYKDIQNYKNYEYKYGINPKFLNAGVAFPINLANFKNKLVGAVGYRTFYDFASKVNIEGTDSFDAKFEETDKIKGLINVLSFGFGTSFSDNLSFGVSYNIPMLSGYKFESEATVKSAYATNKYEKESEYDVAGTHFMQLGCIAQLTNNLSLGIAYLTSHKYKLEEGKTTEKTDGQITYESDLADERWEFPSRYSIGIAYRMGSDLLLAAEYQNRPWEDVEIDGDELYYLESGGSYRIGFEYGSGLLIRGGFLSERIPDFDVDEDPVNVNSLTGGVGYKTGNIVIDLGAAYTFKAFDYVMASSKYYEYQYRHLVVFANVLYAMNFSL